MNMTLTSSNSIGDFLFRLFSRWLDCLSHCLIAIPSGLTHVGTLGIRLPGVEYWTAPDPKQQDKKSGKSAYDDMSEEKKKKSDSDTRCGRLG